MQDVVKNNKTTVLALSLVAIIACSLFLYLMWYVSPSTVVETVKVIAITDEGCIVETMDGYPFNIGFCNAEPGDIISAKIDSKVKERELLMNPTS